MSLRPASEARTTVRALPTGARRVALGPGSRGCRLSQPSETLPAVGWTGGETWYELPTADGRQGRAEQRSRLYLDSRSIGELTLTGGLARPSSSPGDETGESAGPEEPIERLVSFHIEQCHELVYPSHSQARLRRRLAGGLIRCDWREARETYWRAEDSDGPLRLIVRIAEECGDTLQSVCLRPRKVLRRVRELSRLERVQQIDDACVRWLVRQPGRHVLEKAGPRRRVMAVQRIESSDTPENRVVRDMLERILVESARYLREHQTRASSPRFRSVRRLRSLASRLLKDTEIGLVPRSSAMSSPNYALQFDRRYALLWTWYERLRRQQSSVEAAWVWRRRIFIEHVRFALADALSARASGPSFHHRLYLRPDHRRGRFLSRSSVFSPWSFGGRTLSLILDEEFAAAIDGGAIPSWVGGSGADLCVADDAGRPRALVYAQLLAEGETSALPGLVEHLEMATRDAPEVGRVDALLLTGDASGGAPAPPARRDQPATSGAERSEIRFSLPSAHWSAELWPLVDRWGGS